MDGTSARYRERAGIVAAAFGLLLLTACQPEIPVEPDEPVPVPTSVVEQESRASDTIEPSRSAQAVDELAGWSGDVDLLEDGHNSSGDFATLRRDVPFDTAITAGERLTITFLGGALGDEESLCSVDHRVEVDETDAQIEIRVIQLHVLADDVSLRDCPPPDTPWAMTSRLVEPLGGRDLIDVTSGRSVFVVEEEARLMPTWLPEGWVTLRDDALLPLRTIRYVSPAGEVMVFQSAPISAGFRLTDHRDDIGWEPTTVRNPDDGVFLSLEDRRTSVTFEEQGWYYKVNSTSHVDPSVVLQFVRSFERPNLVEGERDPRLTAREVLEPQPGQEEREAQAIQATLED